MNLVGLSLPRLVSKGDPDLTLPAGLRRSREKDERKVRDLQVQVAEAIRQQDSSRTPDSDRKAQVGALLRRTYEILYGLGVTPRDRQLFLERYGCTGYTDEVLDAIVEVAGDERGIVEIGAGNGQWARALTDRHIGITGKERQRKKKKKSFDFVLAYDDMSALPLNPQIYHKRTKPHHDYFYDEVRPCGSDDLASVLRRWECRGRVLLLVYPSPPSPQHGGKKRCMSADALGAYVDASPLNDTVVYVGEGRGGANAGDGFFDILEGGGRGSDDAWVLLSVLPVKPFGSKGYEKMYVFKRIVAVGQRHEHAHAQQ